MALECRKSHFQEPQFQNKIPQGDAPRLAPGGPYIEFPPLKATVYPKGAQAPLGTVSMPCVIALLLKEMVWEYNDRTEYFKIRRLKNINIDLPFLAVCITCVFIAFGGVSSERFFRRFSLLCIPLA